MSTDGETDQRILEGMTVADISNEIATFLNGQSTPLFAAPKGAARSDVIMEFYEAIQDRNARGRLRRAVRGLYKHDGLFSHGPSFAVDLLNLIGEMAIDTLSGSLTNWATTKYLPIPDEDTLIRTALINTLVEFDAPQRNLAAVIDYNMETASCTQTCLMAAVNLLPKPSAFAGHLRTALGVRRVHPDVVRLDTVVEFFISNLGEENWHRHGGEVLREVDSELAGLLDVMAEADLSPMFMCEDPKQALEFLIRWPDNHNQYVPTSLLKPPKHQRDMLYEYAIREGFREDIATISPVGFGPDLSPLASRTWDVVVFDVDGLVK